MSRSTPVASSVRRLVGWRPSLRVGVLALSGAVVIGLAFAIAVNAADHLRRTATDSARTNAEAIVRGYVDPILTESALALHSLPNREVQDELLRLVESGEMRLINVWTRDGRILYSTQPRLIGQRFDIEEELSEAFAGETVAEVKPADATESAPAALPQRVLEIYVPIRGAADSNPIGVFEVYIDARPIEQRVDETRRDVFIISLGAGIILLGALWLAFAGASRRLSQQNRRLLQLNERLSSLAANLKQSEARFRSLVQNSSDVVAVLDADGRVTYLSDAVRPVLGSEPDAQLGRRFADNVHPDDRPMLDAVLTRLNEREGAEQGVEFRLRHADGSWRWMEAVGVNLQSDAAVGGLVFNYRDVTVRRQLEQQLQHEAFHDPLTGLANRALFADRVTHALTRLTRHREDGLAVLFLDLDDFKVVNDSLGHAAGDELLTSVAERIRACIRGQDTAARLGGDEFAVLVEEAGRELPAEIADRILGALRQPFTLAGRQVFVEASIGIAVCEQPGRGAGSPESAEELLRNADAAMYTAKSLGKGRYQFFAAQMHASALRRLELRSRMEAALEADEFVLRYQPVVELTSGETAGVEALVRWQQPGGALSPPGDFIPLAEETGLIIPLGAWVLEESCRQAAEWQQLLGVRPFSIAVNVSSRQLQETTFVDRVAAALGSAGLPAGDLILELTESALLDEGETTMRAISALKELGVRIGLDDFGTGYSSLSHLRRFPIDILKIDRSFVNGIDGERRDERTLVRSIIRLALSLKLETVAEGVERPEQVVGLRALGARYGQGFYFAKPMDAAATSRLLRRQVQAAG